MVVDESSNGLNWKIYCDDHSSLSSTTAVQIWIISYILHIISPSSREDMNSINWPRSQCVASYIAQLVEHRTGIAEVTGSNPVEALIFFRILRSNCSNWKIYCDDHSSLSFTTVVQIRIISYILHILKRNYRSQMMTSCRLSLQLLPVQVGLTF